MENIQSIKKKKTRSKFFSYSNEFDHNKLDDFLASKLHENWAKKTGKNAYSGIENLNFNQKPGISPENSYLTPNTCIFDTKTDKARSVNVSSCPEVQNYDYFADTKISQTVAEFSDHLLSKIKTLNAKISLVDKELQTEKLKNLKLSETISQKDVKYK